MGVLRFLDVHDPEFIDAHLPKLSQADFDNAMFLITEDRKVNHECFASQGFIWNSP